MCYCTCIAVKNELLYKDIMNEKWQHFFDLLWGMTEKEFKVRYKRTVFGFLWVIINPLLQMIVIGTVFRFFIKEEIPNYFFFLFIGLLIWNFFSLSLNKVTPSIVYERSLIKKARFPRIVIPLSIIISNFIHLLIGIGILLVPLIFSGIFAFSHFLIVIPALLWLLLVTTGFGLITSALNVRFRDIAFFVQAVLILWFYATPIVYTMSFIPHHVQWIWYLNPLTSITELFQFALIKSTFPAFNGLLITFIISVLMVYVGVWYFNKESKNFDDWV